MNVKECGCLGLRRKRWKKRENHDNMTPTKWIKILHASLGTSLSTSFLISETPVPPSSIKIHEPNYEKPPAALSELNLSGNSEDEADMSTEQIRNENKKL